MAGLPEKMVEYLLETRIDAHVEDGYVDTFFEDFVLTHMIYMPPNILCNYLKNYYMRGSTVCLFVISLTGISTFVVNMRKRGNKQHRLVL